MNPSTPQSSWAWKLYAPLAMVLGLGFLALLCLSWTPFAILGHRLLPRKNAQHIGRIAIMYCFRIYTGFLQRFCGFHLNLESLDAIASQPGSHVLVANHPSLLDAVLITSRIPNAVCIMKGALIRNVFLGAGARMAGYIVNDSALTMVRRGVDALQKSPTVLVIFPEGRRTRQPPLDACQDTAGVIAARAGVPVTVLSIRMSSPYLGKQLSLFHPPTLPLHIAVDEVAQFKPDKTSVQNFGQRIHDTLSQALTEPQPVASTASKAEQAAQQAH